MFVDGGDRGIAGGICNSGTCILQGRLVRKSALSECIEIIGYILQIEVRILFFLGRSAQKIEMELLSGIILLVVEAIGS